MRGHSQADERHDGSLARARLLPAFLDIMLARMHARATGAADDPHAADHHEAVRQAARAACEELQALADAFHSDVPRAAAGQAQGAFALASGDARAALGPLRHAFELWERLEAPYESALVRVLIGLTCRALDDEDASALELAAARATFEQLGAAPALARLDAIATAAMSAATNARDTSRGAQAHAHVLTARERDVLRLIAAGHTNKAIATTLRLSARTIDRHVSNILDKLDVPTRAAATAYAYLHKLL